MPSPQPTHAVDPGWLTSPAAQLAQSDASWAPLAAEKVPAPHTLHLLAEGIPLPVWKVPATHSLQLASLV
jgi:hypothetical protein